MAGKEIILCTKAMEQNITEVVIMGMDQNATELRLKAFFPLQFYPVRFIIFKGCLWHTSQYRQYAPCSYYYAGYHLLARSRINNAAMVTGYCQWFPKPGMGVLVSNNICPF